MLNGWEIVLILALALIMFGAKKLPELARGLGQGIREFKRASREATEQFQSIANEPVQPALRIAAPTETIAHAPVEVAAAATESPKI